MPTNVIDQYLPLPVFLFLPSVYFVIHATEELPGFGPWATKHFAPLSTGLFATVHIPLILLVFLASYQATQSQKHGAWIVFAVAWQIQFGLNAGFHLVTAVLFREYAPGMMTAGSIGLPLTLYMLARVWHDEILSGQELVTAFAVGTALAIAAIGILFVHRRGFAT